MKNYPIDGLVRVVCTRIGELNFDQLTKLQQAIQGQLDSCNVATAAKISPKTALFDSCNDDTVQSVEINQTMLNDFQILREAKGEDIRKTLIGLMEEYKESDSLNLILLHDVLETRQSYIKFTAQLANYLVHNQPHYPQVKVQFDPLTTRLGIFCRRGTETSSLNSSFVGSIMSALRVWGSAQVEMADIPISYLGNRAALKHVLTHKLGRTPRIVWTKDAVSVFIK